MEKSAQYWFSNHVRMPGPAKAAVWPSKDRLKAGVRGTMAVIGRPIETDQIKFEAWMDINHAGWREQEAADYAAWLDAHPEWQDEE